MLLLAFRTRCPSRVDPSGHGLLRSHRSGPASGFRDGFRVPYRRRDVADSPFGGYGSPANRAFRVPEYRPRCLAGESGKRLLPTTTQRRYPVAVPAPAAGRRLPGPDRVPYRRRDVADSPFGGYGSPANRAFRVPEYRPRCLAGESGRRLLPTTTQRRYPAPAPVPAAGRRPRITQAPTTGSTTSYTGRWRPAAPEATQPRCSSWHSGRVVPVGSDRMVTGSCVAIVRVRPPAAGPGPGPVPPPRRRGFSVWRLRFTG